MEVEARRLQAIAETGVTEEGTGHETDNSMIMFQQDNREEIQQNDLVQEVLAEDVEQDLQNQLEQNPATAYYPWADRQNLLPQDGPQLLPLLMMRAPNEGAAVVNLETIAPGVGLPGHTLPEKRWPGQRSVDRRQRNKRSCFYCTSALSQQRRDRASSCAGKKYRKNCPYGPEVGQN
jgi:hypothetical protein